MSCTGKPAKGVGDHLWEINGYLNSQKNVVLMIIRICYQ